MNEQEVREFEENIVKGANIAFQRLVNQKKKEDGVSGVGISFGADRIFDVLNQLDLYPKEAVNGTELLFVNFGEKEAAFSMNMPAKLWYGVTAKYRRILPSLCRHCLSLLLYDCISVF